MDQFKATGQVGSCPYVTVLEDSKNNWPGKCGGLTTVTLNGTTCEQLCRQTSSCSTYQVSDLGCLISVYTSGSDCLQRDPGNYISDSKRLQHGTVRVLIPDLSKVQIMGLSQAFKEFSLPTNDAIKACRNTCYSNVACTWWQYYTNYGCWVEDAPSNLVEYPITNKSYTTSTNYAADAIAGEYIQHLCPGFAGVTMGATPYQQPPLMPPIVAPIVGPAPVFGPTGGKPAGDALPTQRPAAYGGYDKPAPAAPAEAPGSAGFNWMWIIIAVAVILVLAVAAYFFTQQGTARGKYQAATGDEYELEG